jgi:hypothetical protein
MGTQSLNKITLESRRKFFENKMIDEGKDYLLFKHYHLGDPTDFKKLIHINNLHRAHSSENCDVQNFIEKQFKPDHNYMKVENTRMCEEFDICYNN